ncbi:hypothetical protein HanIR_Chr14g0677581 [Helianthus annuus]|nr:hypothetical protein HanIR_Chr14g0677581 [Helianthus annuus]
MEGEGCAVGETRRRSAGGSASGYFGLRKEIRGSEWMSCEMKLICCGFYVTERERERNKG